MRKVIFRDYTGCRIPARKFYENIPRINELDRKRFFNYGCLYGFTERVEFYSDDGYVAGEIIVLDVNPTK